MDYHVDDDDQMLLISQYYPDLCNELLPAQQVEAKPVKRRRRRSKGEAQRNGGGTRKIKLSKEQVSLLERSFEEEHKLESERKDKLAAELRLDPRQVAVWFQNRRAKLKSKKLEEEYCSMKSQHDNAVVEKRRLQNEMLNLKEKLQEAEETIRKLSDGCSNNSPALSLEPHFLGHFGLEGLEQMMHMPQNNYVHGFEWLNLCDM